MCVLLERKKRIDICNISATALCGNFKPDPYLQGNSGGEKESDSYENQIRKQNLQNERGS